MTFRPKCGRSLFYAKDADKILRNDLSEKGRFCYNSFKRKINNIFQKKGLYMSSTIITTLEQIFNDLTKSQKKVAEYILKDTMKSAFSTIDQISHELDVSNTTVVRLANSAGYGTFSEFQAELKDYVYAKAAPTNKFRMEEGSRQPVSESILSFMEQELDNIRSTCAGIEPDQLERICRRLDAADHIYVIGKRSNEGSSRYLAYNLSRMFNNAAFFDADTDKLPLFISNLNPNDVVIGITFSRYVASIVTYMKNIREQGVYQVCITDYPDSPLVAYSDEALYASVETGNFYHSTVAVALIANLIINECGKLNPERVKRNLDSLETVIRENNLMTRI